MRDRETTTLSLRNGWTLALADVRREPDGTITGHVRCGNGTVAYADRAAIATAEDRGAVAQAARRASTDPGRPTVTEIAEGLDSLYRRPAHNAHNTHNPAPPADSVNSVHCVRDGEAWEPPVPLDAQGDLPPFPVDALPPALATMVRAVATATQTPPDLAGLLALASVAAAIGKTATLQVREGWAEPLAFWALIALDSGNRKSVVFREMTAPLAAWELAEAARAGEAIALAESEHRMLEAALARAEQDAAKAKPDARPEAERLMREAARALARHRIPVAPRLYLGDTTPEALAGALYEQGGALAVMAPEGGIFETIAGRYANGVPNLDLFLCGYSGDDYRRTRGKRTEVIGQATLTLALAVQPDVLRGLADHPGFRGRGLLARFWYALPASFVGRRKIAAPPVPAAVREAYAAMLRGLLDLRPPIDAAAPAPHALTLTPDAAEQFMLWEEEIEQALDEFGALGSVADWGAKLAGGTARVAGLMHLAEHGAAGIAHPIDDATILRAVALARWALAHALAAHGTMGADERLADAHYALRAIERRARQTGEGRTTRRDLHQQVRARFPKPSDLDAPLAMLVEFGYLRPAATPERSGPGRKPSDAYLINPWVTDSAHNSHNTQNGGDR